MQTNYTPKMSLRNKIITGVISAGIGLASLVSSGCAIQRALTPEEQAKEDETNLFFASAALEREEKRQEENLYFAGAALEREEQRQKVQTQQPTKQQTSPNDWVGDVYKGMFIRAGAGILEGEYWLNKK